LEEHTAQLAGSASGRSPSMWRAQTRSTISAGAALK
jgi:hypothetical protein